MVEHSYIFRDISMVFAAALVCGLLAWRLRQPIRLGYVLAGLFLGNSAFTHKLAHQTQSLRDVFVAFFFVSVGMLMDPGTWKVNWPLILLLVGLVLFGKFVVWTGVVWLFRYRFRTAFRVGLGLTQIGEFSFILAQVSMKAGLISPNLYHATLAASLITILANATIFRFLKPAAGSQPAACDPAESRARARTLLRGCVGKDFLGILSRVGKRRLDGMENETTLKLHLLQRFTQLQHGGNDAAQHREQAKNEEHGSEKGGGREKPACDESQAADNQDGDGGEKKQQSPADQPGALGHLKRLSPQHFQELLMIPGTLFRPLLLLLEHFALKEAQTRHERRQPAIERKREQPASRDDDHGHDRNADDTWPLRKAHGNLLPEVHTNNRTNARL